MSYTTYEFTAYTEADLLAAGAEGHSVSCGDTFTMSGTATTCFEVSDNDAFLSGDNCRNENANDKYGQQAAITGEDGNELGNGGQIYAEKYFWVCDDAGNWYVLIEIEQEGSGDDYFTFYTGHGYTVPEEGTELTVYSSCNVKGSWIDFDCLDAGEKGPDTGSISGRVFCDDDCDGIDGGVTVIEGCDYTIEAEDMDAWGFKTVHGAHASGGELVRLQCAGQTAAIKTDFQGKDGVYDVSLFIQDECDGASKIKLLVNGQVVEAIRLDRQSDGVGSNNGGFSEFVIEGVELKAGDEVKLWAEGNGYEFVRIDKLEFNGRDQEVRTEEPGKEGVVVVLLDANGDEVLDGNGDRIETVTDANGEYTFDGVPVGDYRVKFENPDGTEFTFQNVGSDDAIDSDVDANGVSDVISVVADQTTSDVDAGLKPAAPELGSIAGRYFCDENDDGAETDGGGNFDAGVAGATVWLLQGGAVIASTMTDSNGDYIFEGLEAGNYSVRFEDPDDVSAATEGKNFIAANQADDAVDSDVVNVGGAGNGNTATITLAAGENKTDVDGGIKQQFMVCDDPNAVLIDFEGIDGDVSFEAFEAGRVIDNEYAAFGVTISAQRASDIDPTRNDAMVFDSTNPTGGDSDLETFNQGNLLIVSEDNESSDPDDAVGGVITFDFANPSRIFDLKVIDTEEGGTVELFDADSISLGVIDLPNLQDGGLEQVMIDADGVSRMVVTLNGSGAIDDICIVPGQPGPGSLSGRYFFDADRDGLDDDGANGISGIQVELLDENSVGLNIFETTDDQGNYSFGNLDEGVYGVKFTDPDTGRELTTQNVDGDVSDDIDSDAFGLGGGMSVINGIIVVGGQDTPDNDAGVVEKPGSLSGTYFCDDDRDGVDDGAALGDLDISNKTVTLLNADGTAARDIDGNLVASVQTDAQGNYRFDNLAAGDYRVQFQEEADKEFIAKDVGGDDTIDSDVNPVTGITDPVTVVAGEETKNVDAGVQDQAGSLSGTYFCDDDRDGIDDGAALGDLDIANKTVTLLNADGTTARDIDGNPVASVQTDAQGNYRFTNLAAGDYRVQFQAVVDKPFTAPNVGDNGMVDAADDSDVTDLVNGKTAPVTVVAGEETENVDAGVFPNQPPVVDPDMAKGCADELIFVDFSDNFNDPNAGAGDTASVTAINGQEISPGGDTISISILNDDGETKDVNVTLTADNQFIFDGEDAFAFLDIGEEETESFTVTVTDSIGASSQANIDVTFCGDANSAESLDTALKAAGTQVTFNLPAPTTFAEFIEAYTLDLTASTNADIQLGTYAAAYCLDQEQAINYTTVTTASVCVLTEANLAAVAPTVDASNFDSINWLLNFDQTLVDNGDGTGDTYTDYEVQEAIWLLMNGETNFLNQFNIPELADNNNGVRDGIEIGTLENIEEIAINAINQGDGFVAGDSDVIGLILDPISPAEQDQPFVIGVNFNDVDCIC